MVKYGRIPGKTGGLTARYVQRAFVLGYFCIVFPNLM